MKINELEKMLGLSKANIRYYESEGLITPKRTENGYRDYSDSDARLLKKIIVYRKLGIPISEIKSVLNEEKSLNQVVASSIEDMRSNIGVLAVAIEVCEEIRDKNIDNADFDTDYFWNEINNRELKGEEFIDFGNIDITSYKNKKHIKIALIILTVLFFGGIIYSFVCNFLFVSNNNENYKELLPEIKTSDIIDTVKIDENNKLIYVCYSRASCINTYGFDGDFKWAVSVPCLEHRGTAYFYLEDNKILIDNEGEVFIYNSLNGDFIERAYAEDLGLTEKRDQFNELHQADIDLALNSGISFDIYNVYLSDKTVVSTPFYVVFQNGFFGLLISFISGLAIAIVAFIGKFRLINRIEVDKSKIGKTAKIHRAFNITVIALYIIFGVCNAVISIFQLPSISVGIFPATLLLIISLILNNATKNRRNASEHKYVGITTHFLVIAFVILLISVIIFVSIF